MRNLIAFFKRFQIFLVFVVLQIISLYFYFSFFTYPKLQFLTSASTMTGKIWSVKNDITKHFNLESSNVKLQKSNEKLMEQLPQSFIRINQKEVSINDTLHHQKYKYISAEVINSTVEKRNNYFTINTGKLQGIKKGMGVISDKGVVGIIHSCSKHFSVVKSVLTSDINISVLTLDKHLFGLLKWNGNNARIGSISGVSNDYKIKKWSLVVTRGSTGIFPSGIPVGKVHSMSQVEGSAFWDLSILFSEDYRTLQRVYVVKNILYEEQTQLEQTIPKEKVKE